MTFGIKYASGQRSVFSGLRFAVCRSRQCYLPINHTLGSEILCVWLAHNQISYAPLVSLLDATISASNNKGHARSSVLRYPARNLDTSRGFLILWLVLDLSHRLTRSAQYNGKSARSEGKENGFMERLACDTTRTSRGAPQADRV